MVRPWLKKGPLKVFMYCDYCEEWYPRDEFVEEDFYQTDDNDYIEVDNSYYYREYTQYTIWMHSGGCDENAAAVDTKPRRTKVEGAYICGECSREHPTEDKARECCE
jgi:hypothetical protein